MTSNRPFVLSIVAVLFVVATALFLTETSARTWKTEKFSVEGDFDSLQDNGTKVRIKRSDGKFVRVDLNKLSEEDQKYIEQNFPENDFVEEPEKNDFEEEPTSSNIPPVSKEENLVDNLIKAVNLLENEGQYLIARQKLLTALQGNFSEKLVDIWIQLDSKLCSSIQNNKCELSVFTPEEITWKERYEQSLAFGERTICSDPAPINSHSKKYADIRKSRFDKDAAKDFGTLDKDSISKTLEIYETLKKSTESLLSYLNNEMFNTEDSNQLKKLSDYSAKVKVFKNRIKIQRTNYLSYCVVSPYLADTARWLYLSESQKEWFLWPQKEALDKAIKVLSFSCHGQHLYECNEDVRKQFFDVQKKLKSMVSSTVYEELKVLTTLIDSSDPSKKRGADAWWE